MRSEGAIASTGSGRLGQAMRRLLPSSGPAIGAEPALSTGGGGFRSANRPEPPVRGESIRGEGGGYGRGGPQLGGSGGGGPRMPRGGSQAPRPERYWTDYLRIALPIIGLILMLSLFIFWVGNIINDDDGGSGTATVPVALVTSTAAPSVAAGGQATETAPPAQSAAASAANGGGANPSAGNDNASTEPTTAPAAEATQPPGDQATETPTDESAAAQPTDEPAGSGAFAVDDVVTIPTEFDGATLRSEASTDGEALATLSEGAQLTIVGGPENDGDFDWYEVTTTVDGTDLDGWIREDLIAAQ